MPDRPTSSATNSARARALEGTFANPVRAAGAVPWRHTEDGELEVLLVRSQRWNEWSWPKGKHETRETAPEAAVREVEEETGARIALGPPLPAVRYVMPDQRHKRVTYWAAKVTQEGRRSAPPSEIAETAWLSVSGARETLTRPGDLPPLIRAVELDRQGRLDADQLIIVRHAKAVGRSAWKRDDASRPLAEVGVRQSGHLARQLDCWHPDRLLSSPWSRCLGTFTPYEGVSGVPIEPVKAFTEKSYENHPRRTAKLIDDLLTQPGRIAVCTHRPVLEGVIGAIAGHSEEAALHRLPDDTPWLAPAGLLIAHHQGDRVFWVELH